MMSSERAVAGGVAGLGQNSLSRRNFLRLGGVGLAGVALLGASACGGGENSGNVVLSYWEGIPEETQYKLIKKFNEQNKGEFQITLREMPQDYGEYFDKLKTEFQARGGEMDVIAGDTIWTAEFAENDWIADVSERFPETERSRFVDGAIRSLTYDGKVYGAPHTLDAGMLYYRKDLLEKSGFSEPPKTWEELKEMARNVVQDQGTRYGFVFQGANYEGGVCNGLEFIWTHGGEVLDPNDASKVIIDSPESVAALSTWQSMVSDGVAPQSVANYTESESDTTFMLHGDAVFCRNWPYMYALAANSRSKVTPEQVGVSPLPVGDGQSQSASCLGGDVVLINASSEKKEEAWEFVQFFNSVENQKTWALDQGDLPTRKALYDERGVLEAMPMIAQAKEALLNVRPRPVSGHYSEMARTMALQFNNVLRGATSPEVAVKTLQSKLQQIIEGGR
jgi:multiple sugar transport system substrate-binding protein